MNIVVLMPVFNDWLPAQEVVRQLDDAFALGADSISILLIDDGSTESPATDFSRQSYRKIEALDVLKLKRNLGHQRALAVGLCHLASQGSCDAVLVMDSDGQDAPEDACRLAKELAGKISGDLSAPIIFAERSRRSESWRFRLGYQGYRILHYVLTGYKIRFGNFSIIPSSRLAALTTDTRLWNHYAASVVGGKVPFTTLSTQRRSRLSGDSHLNAIALVTHGLSALSCYNEIIGVRIVVLACVFLAISLVGLLTTLGLRLLTASPSYGWTSLFAGLLIIFLFQIITLASNFTMQIIGGRSFQPFLPIRDYAWYIDRVKRLFPSAGS